MMNVTGLGVNPTDNSQLAFKAKKPNRKQIHEFMKEAAKKQAAKQLMLDNIKTNISEGVKDIMSPRNIVKVSFDVFMTKTAIGLGKFLGKCDKVLNKIPFIRNARMKKMAKYEEQINNFVNNGVTKANK